jgi:pimeloyl-ACP methyl ester carboxylesterase
MNDIEHKVENLAAIQRPVLVMYSPNDRTVSPRNAMRVAREVATCELYEVPSDTHLIWIGKSANDVWQKRLSFLRSKSGLLEWDKIYLCPLSLRRISLASGSA